MRPATVALVLALCAGCAKTQAPRVLRVCADPNNLPFSDRRERGFENRIAEVLATELGARLEYTWMPQRRGFFRASLGEGRCEVVMGVPAGFERALTTRPYYRSSYVFVTRVERKLDVHSLDDARLRSLKLGVQLVGDDGVNTPPAHALSQRGLVDNVTGFTVYGDYAHESPPATIVRAVEQGDIDVGLVWGPLAGYFARERAAGLDVAVIQRGEPDRFFTFDIALGVRRGHPELRDELQRALDRRQRDVTAILEAYGVPLLALPQREARR